MRKLNALPKRNYQAFVGGELIDVQIGADGYYHDENGSLYKREANGKWLSVGEPSTVGPDLLGKFVKSPDGSKLYQYQLIDGKVKLVEIKPSKGSFVTLSPEAGRYNRSGTGGKVGKR